jgi:ribosomal protein S1
VSDYSWPADGERLAKRARQTWAEAIEALPIGSAVSGEVVGRQPFGVFIGIDQAPGAIGLAEAVLTAKREFGSDV